MRHAENFVDPALSFANGWNQLYSWAVSIPAELVAAAVIIEFWITVNDAIWIVSLGVLIVCAIFPPSTQLLRPIRFLLLVSNALKVDC
jgi:amino acid transporter